MRSHFNKKTVLITGGTGSLGIDIVNALLVRSVGRVCVLSRDERKHVEMKKRFPNEKIRYFIGDVRDRTRLEMAMNGVDYVVHAAAMKHVDLCEYNPWECGKTNVVGTQNVIDAAINAGVKRVLFVSSDKAVNPTNIYGASKLMGERLMLGAENYAGEKGSQFAIIRFGNFMYSSGSVLELWRSMYRDGQQTLPITNRHMTRFWISLPDAATQVINALQEMYGGEIFIPKMSRVALTRMARIQFPQCEFVDIPERPGEKVHEEMLLESEAERTVSRGDHYVIGKDLSKGSLSIVDMLSEEKYILK